MKQAGVSLWLCIHNLLNLPQHFLFPSQILNGNKLEVVTEILRLCCELCVHPLIGEAALGGSLLSGI